MFVLKCVCNVIVLELCIHECDYDYEYMILSSIKWKL